MAEQNSHSPEEIPSSEQGSEIGPPQVSTTFAIYELFLQGKITDPVDKRYLIGASEFLRSPTNELSEIVRHETNVGQVLSGYNMNGEDAPAEIHAIYQHLFTFHCECLIALVKKERTSITVDTVKVEDLMADLLRRANVLAKGYNDPRMLEAAQTLQQA